MFERYTERARRVIFFARYEASQFGSTTIETEHFLLGLISEDKNLTNRFLRNSQAIDGIRREIESRSEIREKVSTAIDLPLSHECKRILAYAAEEAERLNHRHIGTEHLLLGILREEKSVAAEILHNRGLRLDPIREELAHTVVDRPGAAGQTFSNVPPKEAMVPDTITAKRIAQAIWIAAYGTEMATVEGAIEVSMNRGSWQIIAGPLFAIIRSLDGSVVGMGRSIEGTNV